ncbi:putative methyltransferase-domain-containing protein [Microdochium trichocladiopsis]|uniref:25S rRNA adenine-N(1) methyltransferase n=1 Tax=Microdochium trichocladiopsis TaxID=1682393 RepID=A0A9P8YEZ0_9PEZI|nr:putative methyltransferase-domain-containing protein [Microdochium trichocladiopsis]KAH7037761.1 putative methyltransferase-domain-containing protein [Microdochium trichocladiopsis]
MRTKKKQPARSLASTRPPTLKKQKSISRKATKSLINSLHLLQKKKAQAVAKGDLAAQAAIDAEITALGGLEKYQQASLQGQRNDRGGDSSRVLMEWLQPTSAALQELGKTRRLRMLEVGALSVSNECSKSGLFDVERIDLSSQGEGILQQDFMERPLPKNPTGLFDIISLSLVLNFVPDAAVRGQMLRRTLSFLRDPNDIEPQELRSSFPSLFMVLPAPCVTNSRYMDEDLLKSIMTSLGYTQTHRKLTQRLVYYLWTRKRLVLEKGVTFKKAELRSGGSRNNFSIIVRNP